MNEIGFMTPAINQLPVRRVITNNNLLWDRRTVVILASGRDITSLHQHFRQFHKPQATSHGKSYDIDIFVNLNYNRDERDPANRHIRIVYANSDMLSMEEINSRFPNSYILIIESLERSEQIYGTPRIGGSLS